MPKVSIIVPVYNVQDYIERCCNSLFGQTLLDIEYIFIDDASEDDSVNRINLVLNNYKQRKAQVHFIHHNKNLGTIVSRYDGIRIAQGDYIIHCDADDWIEKDMYEKMYNQASTQKLDIVRCDFCRDRTGESNYCKRLPEEIYADKFAIISKMMTGNDLSSLCDKLVRRTIVQSPNIMPPSHDMQEDMALAIQYIYFSQHIGHIPHAYYHYCFNENSVTREQTIEKTIKRFIDVTENAALISDFLYYNHLTPRFKQELVCFKLNARNHISGLVHIPQYYKMWKSKFPEIDSIVLFCNKVPLREKINWLLIHLRLYGLLKHSMRQLTR